MRRVKKIFCVTMVFFMTILNGCRAEAAVVLRVAGAVGRVTGRVVVGAASKIFRVAGKTGSYAVQKVAKNLAIDAATDKILDTVIPDRKKSEDIIKYVVENAGRTAALMKEKIPDKKTVGNFVEDVAENAGNAAAFMKEKIPDKKAVGNFVEDVTENAGNAAAFMKEKISDKKAVGNFVEDVTENAGNAAAFMKEKISDKVFDTKTPDQKSDDKLVRIDKAASGAANEKIFSDDESRLNKLTLKVKEML